MGSFRFEVNRQGFNDMRNMPGVQRACLNVAQSVATEAAHGKYHYQTDVQPGRTRCHARCSWSPQEAMASMGKAAYFRALKEDSAIDALRDAAGGMR